MNQIINEESDASSLQPKKMDDVLVSILQDLELAEIRLKSTSRLLDDIDQKGNDIAKEIPRSISHVIDDDKSSEVNEIVKNKETCNEQDPKDLSEKNTTDLSEYFKEPIKQSFVDSATDESNTQVHDNYSKDQLSNGSKDQCPSEPNENCLEVIDSQSITSQSENSTDISVPIPNTNPYINFVQDFKAKYKGHEVTPTTLIALAAAKWRKMAKEEKQAYKHIRKSHCEKNKQVEKLKKYIKCFKMTEDTLFQNAML